MATQVTDLKPPIPVYFCPGTLALLDDNSAFLENLCLNLGITQRQRVFTAPQAALDFLQHTTIATQSTWLSVNKETDIDSEFGQLIELHIPAIHQTIYHTQRFTDMPVIIVDYAMPGMNGLEFCRALQHLPIKKIMLTGVANLDIAVEGFNQGIIDKFILKQDASALLPELRASIMQLQWAYYQHLSQPMHYQLNLQGDHCLFEPTFAAVFQQLCQQHQIAEFYLLDSSGSFLLLDATGTTYLLAVKSERDMEDYIDIARNVEQAPTVILEALMRRKKTPYFHTTVDHATPIEQWDNLLYDATLLTGKQAYYYACVPMPTRYLQHEPRILSLYAYCGT